MIAIGAVAIIGIIVASIIGAIIVIAAMGGVGMFAIKHLTRAHCGWLP
jgi:tRNA A37 threonylcarbamoyladenosine dehydratase